MNKTTDVIRYPKEALSKIALETWRLWKSTEQMENQPGFMNIRYSIKKIKDTLEIEGISFIDLTGQEYDSGMAIDILETEEDSSRTANTLIIKEMISPIILWKKKLLKHGSAVLVKGIETSQINQGGFNRE
jgi:hypothetical protein